MREEEPRTKMPRRQRRNTKENQEPKKQETKKNTNKKEYKSETEYQAPSLFLRIAVKIKTNSLASCLK